MNIQNLVDPLDGLGVNLKTVILHIHELSKLKKNKQALNLNTTPPLLLQNHKILKPLYEVTEILCRSNYPTLNFYLFVALEKPALLCAMILDPKIKLQHVESPNNLDLDAEIHQYLGETNEASSMDILKYWHSTSAPSEWGFSACKSIIGTQQYNLDESSIEQLRCGAYIGEGVAAGLSSCCR
ncbi:hypothetical protein VP01_129g4 [Puccinia sorghi]|uniref:HAT C-terminal dimerisation domain-containing protein n=1 Tax=Puccinia sorghi TaxID=27349 RepID=A0A0L6VNE0_9BASI|nr:hypothetical protein VP01_129g4 [Puccinia sorghi]